MASNERIRIGATADLHYTRTSQGALLPLIEYANAHADVLLLCGDLTDFGMPEEARLMAKELVAAKIPILAVLGNHDFETGKAKDVEKILTDVGVFVLDGESCELLGVGFVGAKGFGGGFGKRSLGPWGEDVIKKFVHEAMEEALKLESALARLQTPQKFVLLHYSPVVSTVAGEPPEIYPFLGSSRLEEPLNRADVTAIFHGHAHRGQAEGRTTTNTPVFNVSLPLLRRLSPDLPPLRIVEFVVTPSTEEKRHI